MQNERPLKLVADTGGRLPKSIAGASTLEHTGIVAADGSAYYKVPPDHKTPAASGGDGGGLDATMTTRLDRLEQHRDWLWKVLGLTIAAMGAAFLFLLTQIDSRFDRVDEPLDEIRSAVAAQGAASEEIARRLTRMEDRNEPNTQASD
jgi:hypothetical protein